MTDLCEGVFTILTPGCLHLMFYFNLSWPIKLTGLTISTTREAGAIKPRRNKWEGPAQRGGGQIYAWLIYFYRDTHVDKKSSNIVWGHGWDFKHVCLKSPGSTFALSQVGLNLKAHRPKSCWLTWTRADGRRQTQIWVNGSQPHRECWWFHFGLTTE